MLPVRVPTPLPRGGRPGADREPRRGTRWRAILPPPGRWRRPLRELLLVVLLFAAYKLGRLLGAHHVEEAFANAGRLWDAERALRLPSEEDLQDWLLKLPPAVVAANVYYKYVHFPATALFLVWTYARRPWHYRWARTVLAVMTGVALAVHIAVPLAPPRMLSGLGFVDTAAVYGPGVYGPAHDDGMANQFAAMPSLHVGWAVFVAVSLILSTRTRWRWLWLAHPVVTLGVVVGTANHYWLDAAVALVILAVVMVVLRPPARPRRHPGRDRERLDHPDAAVPGSDKSTAPHAPVAA
ncbi:phosphatase PAP2 family protein [Actinomadura miaoliensis]|uniref:Phosphatase PAP2 family protein n=1 Tax=Actinomadura miaoliensis TaxID=430685 RepID=A0ABP7VDZ2_9ACTN